jgi:phospholipid/cholesterol/gamma-HCH transport system substrate-binding protein
VIPRKGIVAAALVAVLALVVTSCSWRGANSMTLPGTKGHGAGAYTVQAQLPDIDNLERNSRVRVGDVTVGTVTGIERQGWHALVTISLDRDVQLPANATAKVGQTSLFGSKHIELAPPTSVPAEGRLHDGSVIPLSSGSAYPTTERTLAAMSMLLNGGGIGQIQDITQALSTAFGGRENDLRSLIEQLNKYVANLNDQIGDIIAATESVDNLASQFADQKPLLDKAIKVIPDALAVFKDQRQELADALDSVGTFSALASDWVNKSKSNLVAELNELGPVLQSLADAGPSMTRSLSMLTTFPFKKEDIHNYLRGDMANLIGVFDFTLSKFDQTFFTGTRWEGDLTKLEMQWGRTIGQLPSPYTAGNPLVAPYHFDQGP